MNGIASNVVKLPTAKPPMVRQWSAAKSGPLNADWPTLARPIDLDIRSALPVIRARARELAQNNDHAKGFLRMVRNNIVGASGFTLQARQTMASGKPDLRSRRLLESLYEAWSRRGVFEVTGKYSRRGLERFIAESVARDGEAFVRIGDWDNASRMSVQIIDPEAVDILFNGTHKGNDVRMGVELDAYRRPVAYHVFGESPINSGGYRAGSDRVRIPATEMLHIYLPEFCWQTRGVSWLAVAAGRAHMIQGTEDAEVTAARASACKVAAYEAAEWAPPPPIASDANGRQLVDENGNPISSDQGRFSQDLAPGANEVVPYGYSLKLLDPQHPNAAMPDFLKWALRSISTGWGVSYNALGNDAEGVNYTSLRYFLGIERDNWMELQDWFCDELCEPLRAQWTERQIKLGALPTRDGRPHQWHAINWQPRRWEGPDPAKQASADAEELKIGSTTLTKILSRKGIDFDDHLQERIQELVAIRDAANAEGLSLSDVLPYLTQGATQIAPQPDTNADASNP